MRHARIIVFGLTVIVVLSVTAYIGNLAIARYSKLRNDLEDRLQVVRRSNEVGSTMRAVEIKEKPTERMATTIKDGAHTMVFRKGDLRARIYAELGAPVDKEIVGKVETLKYNGCNVVCENGYVIGWVVK